MRAPAAARSALSLALALVCVAFAPAAGAHPNHSVGPDTTPELPAEVYAKRRAALVSRLGTCVAVLKSFASDDGPDNDFYYLTGIEEAGASLLLSPKGDVVKQGIYLPARNPSSEIWTGYKEPLHPGLARRYKVDQVKSARSMGRSLFQALRRSRCYAKLRSAMSSNADVAPDRLGKMLQSLSARTVQRWEELERMRAVHDSHEIVRMEKAIAITKEGHEAAIRALRAGVTEREVSAAITTGFVEHGATGLAFPSIVGSGPNGAVLHWIKNDRTIADSDLVVIDIGASYGHYAADITRTYPVSGTFSPEQRKVYELVLRAQQKAIDAVRPGISLQRLHRIAEQVIVDAGYELPHSLGHFVGLDVHDVGNSDAPLEPGMVITIEPGVYLKGKLGVRIEDEVLVTTRGARVLTSDLPRSVKEVEAWMARVRGKGAN